MKAVPLYLSLLALATAAIPLAAQEIDLEKAEAQGRSVITDPRFQNVLRSVKSDPEGTIDAARKDPDSLVDEATRVFQANRDKIDQIDTSKIDTPANRAKAKALTDAAIAKAGELAAQTSPGEPSEAGTDPDTGPPEEGENDPEADSPAPPRSTEEMQPSSETAAGDEAEAFADSPQVPATRPASAATEFVRPVAMPSEHIPSPISGDRGAESVIGNSPVVPVANRPPTLPRIPESPLLTPSDLPEPEALRPRYNKDQPGAHRTEGDEQMVITARESIMDNPSGILTFSGNVYVDHPGFDLKCENLEVHLGSGVAPTSGGDGAESIRKVIASGGMVEIRRINPEGETQIAMARRAEFDNVSKDFTLSGGPPYIQDGGKFVETNSPDAQIIMRGNGRYEVVGSDAGPKNRTRIVIPVDGPDKTQDIGIGGGMGAGGGIDRLR